MLTKINDDLYLNLQHITRMAADRQNSRAGYTYFTGNEYEEIICLIEVYDQIAAAIDKHWGFEGFPSDRYTPA